MRLPPDPHRDVCPSPKTKRHGLVWLESPEAAAELDQAFGCEFCVVLSFFARAYRLASPPPNTVGEEATLQSECDEHDGVGRDWSVGTRRDQIACSCKGRFISMFMKLLVVSLRAIAGHSVAFPQSRTL